MYLVLVFYIIYINDALSNKYEIQQSGKHCSGKAKWLYLLPRVLDGHDTAAGC